MINKEEYIAVFSQVTASADTHREVENMVNTQKKQPRVGLRRAIVLAAAVVMLMALTVTAFAAEDIANWFRSYFEGRMDGQLSEKQVTLLEETEQPLGQSITHDGWTIDLVSAIHDDAVGYVLLRITVPEEMDTSTNYIFGNFSREGQELDKGFRFITASPGVSVGGWGFRWEPDDDGNDRTRNMLVHLSPNAETSAIDPFGPEAEYYINIEDIVVDNLGEKEGRDEILAEGLWEFTISFADPESSGEAVEMLTKSIPTQSVITYLADDELKEQEGKVLLYSVELRHLSVTFRYADCDGHPEFYTFIKVTNSDGTGLAPVENERIYPAVVLKDGTEIPLMWYGWGSDTSVTMEAKSPIVFEEVSHLRLADGTIIPMPEAE